MKSNNPYYIIISGTNKAATTSVYNYIGDHPKVCPSYIKQSNYFLDDETKQKLKLSSSYQYQKDSLNYNNYFISKDNTEYRLEATPDYMYSEVTIDRLTLFSEKNKAKIVLILRNPISRFNSWYNYGKQQSILPQNMLLNDYYKISKNYKGNSNMCLMAHKTGFYSEYLKPFIPLYNRGDLEILFYEDLVASPSKFIIDFCQRLGIDASFYKEYDFKHFNKTVKTNSQTATKTYNFFRAFYIKYLFKGYFGVKIGGLLKTIFSPLYKIFNTSKLKTPAEEDEVFDLLKREYDSEKEKIQKMFNLKTIPW